MKELDNFLKELSQRQDISRRTFLKTCGAFAVFLGAPVSQLEFGYASGRNSAGEIPDHVLLTWSDSPKTTQTITWRTNFSVQAGEIQYAEGQALADPVNIKSAQVKTFSTNLGDMNIHSATLTGLKPGSKYTYRVGSDRNWSEAKTFTTESANNSGFKFLIFGDSQSGIPDKPEYGPWHTTIHNAFRDHPDAAFFMVLGDLVEVGQDYAHWEKWFDAAQGVLGQIPDMSLLGNHETYNPPDFHTSLPIYFKNQFNLPQTGPAPLKGQAYSFDYGNVHFTILDSQVSEEGKFIDHMLETEKAWLAQDLSATQKPWKLVFFHKPPYYNKATRTNEKLKAAFLPILDQYHADVVFNGHDHGYSRTYPLYQDSFVASPDKGTVYIVAGRSGAKSYPDLSKKIWDAFFHDPQEEPNYLAVEATGNQLTVQAFKQSGELIDTYTIDKVTGGDSPKTILPAPYQQTQLVIYGSPVQSGMSKVNPQKISGVWYVPIQAFFTFVKSNVDSYESGKIDITYGKKEIELMINSRETIVDGEAMVLTHPVTADSGNAMISAEDLRVIAGFSYKFDTNMNMLMFTK